MTPVVDDDSGVSENIEVELPASFSANAAASHSVQGIYDIDNGLPVTM